MIFKIYCIVEQILYDLIVSHWAVIIDISFNMQIVKLNVKMEFKQMKVLVDMNPQQQLTVLSFLKRFVDVCGINHVEPQDFELYDGQFILPHQLPAFWINDKKTYSVVQTIRDKKTIIKQKQIWKQCKVKKKQSKIQSSSSSDSSSSSQRISESSSDLQNFRKHKKQIGIQKKPIQKKQKVMKSNIIERVKKFQQYQLLEQEDKVKKPQAKPEQMKSNANGRGGRVNPIQKQQRDKKVVISSESSESSSQKPAHYRQKVRQIVQQVNEKTKKQQQQRKNMMKTEIEQKQKPATVAKPAIKIPISVRKNTSNSKPKKEQNQQQSKQEAKKVDMRDKPQQKQKLTFKQYQQMQWLPISKNELNLWKEQCQNQPILCPGNQIRFKVMELDQEKFVPVTSGWITGFVTTVQDDSAEVLICLKRVTQQQKDGSKQKCIDNYEIPFHNMQQLQVRKMSLDNKQSQVLEKNSNQKQKQVQSSSKAVINVQKVEQKEKVKQQSLQQFICGQIHYYFGQKNYPTDLFMQMHANNDENKYINYKLMLNFPKIKKVLADENKIWDYLVNDDKLPSRNYQLDVNRKMIRRK